MTLMRSNPALALAKHNPGSHTTIAEIAAAEQTNETYVGRVLRLTLLAPDIVEAILGGRQPAEVTLAVLMRRFPVLSETQPSYVQSAFPEQQVR
ncbi:MAG: hypothetical protein WEA28_00490 [Xanthobacteraceae bacterium]|jgi:hypothetical protein